jgi:ribose 5-phosphate isomerase B
MEQREIRELVRRVVGRALAERGTEAGPAASTAGVHVALHASGHPLRPAEASRAGAPHRGRPLVAAAELAGVARNGEYQLPADALVTELAREEAWSRGIALRTGSVERATSRLRVALGADHGGFALKRSVAAWLGELGHVVVDLGTHDENPVDYPDFAAAVGRAIAERRADLGICVDGAGIGSAIAANKIPGVRAAMCYDVATARNAREHNHANVLTLGGKLLTTSAAFDVVRAFLSTPVGPERHARRVAKITALERDAR